MPSSARWLGPLLACAAAACSGQPPPPVRIRLAHTATPDARCFVPGGPQPEDLPLAGVTLGDLTIETVRITVREHAAGDVAGNFVCDRVLRVPKDVPSLKLPRSTAQSVDIYAEAWAPVASGDTIPRRVAVGALLDVPLTAKTLPDLRLYPDERFACLNQAMARPRAFHSATLLPNGQVLVVGGLTPAMDPSQDAFSSAPLFLTNEAEVYDPATAAFIAVQEGDSPLPRAFHQAAFVGATSDGKYQVLLVGGATADPASPAFGINTGAVPGARIVPFDTSGTFPTELPVSAAATELLVYDPVAHTATRTAMVGFTPGVYQGAAAFGDGIAVAGGIDWMGSPLQAAIPTINRIEVSRMLETPPRAVMFTEARMGATLTALDDDRGLVWGGQLTPTDAAGEYATGLSAGGTVATTSVTLATAPPTQFHTATILPVDPSTSDRTIVVTGGFVATNMSMSPTMGQALQPPSPMTSARLLTVSATGTVSQTAPTLATYVYDSTCTMDPRYRPAGWESAVDLGRGRVLVSGGAPTITGACNDCDDGGSDFRCSTAQASLFTTPSTIAPALEPMQIARYGHTSTKMADGNVLIVGGVTSAAGNPRVLRDVEIYDPRPIVPDYDASSGNPDPDDPIAGDMTAAVRAPGAVLGPSTECGKL